MQLAELDPHPLLRPYVQLIWCAEFDGAAEFGPPERIAPDGIVELVFHYRGRMGVRAGQGEFDSAPRSALVCQTRRPVDIRPSGPVGLVSVRFRPWGAHQFMSLPLAELADQVLPADVVWGAYVRELEDRLASVRSMAQRVDLIESFLLHQLVLHHKTNVEPVIRAIWRHKGNVRVPDLARQLGVSHRTLHRLFDRSVGMSPKAYAQLTRFLHACAMLRAGHWHSLADVAVDCGYYDQAHFNGQFREHAGMSPLEFLRVPSFSFLSIE